MKKEIKNNNKIYQILLVIFAIGFIVAIAVLLVQYNGKKKAAEKFDELASKTTEVVTEQPSETVTETEEKFLPGITIPEKNLDWAALKEENADIHAWIYIPNTQVDYPVLQSENQNDYYLDHNLDGSSGYPGCIYSQPVTGKDFTDSNTVLYGHNMGDGSMFGSLHQFEDKEFFDENSYIYIYTPEKTFVYEIYAASVIGNEHLLYHYNFGTETGFDRFITDITDVRDMKSHVRENVTITYGQKLLTLSTCIKGDGSHRWIVTGVLLNE